MKSFLIIFIPHTIILTICVFLFISPQLIDYAKKGDTDEKAMKMASFWLTVSVTLCPSECSTVDVKSSFSLTCFFLFRKRIWSQSSSSSSLHGLRLSQMATHGWPASPTDRTWTEPRWVSWSIKATLSRLSIRWKKRMNSLSSTSCSKATERIGHNSYLPKLN